MLSLELAALIGIVRNGLKLDLNGSLASLACCTLPICSRYLTIQQDEDYWAGTRLFFELFVLVFSCDLR